MAVDSCSRVPSRPSFQSQLISRQPALQQHIHIIIEQPRPSYALLNAVVVPVCLFGIVLLLAT